MTWLLFMMIFTEFSPVNCFLLRIGWHGGNLSKQVHLTDLDARFETRFCHDTGSTNTSSSSCGRFVDTFDQSQNSIQHNHPCYSHEYERKHSFSDVCVSVGGISTIIYFNKV